MGKEPSELQKIISAIVGFVGLFLVIVLLLYLIFIGGGRLS